MFVKQLLLQVRKDKMKKYILKRVLQLIPILLGLSILTFLLLYISPGDPAQKKLVSMEAMITDELLEQMREEMGLNRPFWQQYADWLVGILHGDFGTCYRDGLPVADKLFRALKNTAILGGTSMLLAMLLAIPFGIYSAVHQNKIIDYLIRFISFVGNSIPSFLLAVLLMYFFCVKLKLFPVVAKKNGLKEMVLPAIALAVPVISRFTRQVRAEVLDQMGRDYVHGLRSRGVRERYILCRNVLRSVLVSIVTLAGLSLGSMMAGSVVIETIFGWQGIGKLVMDSITARDYPVVQGFVLIFGTIYVMVNLITDLSYHFLDPRIKKEN